MATARPLVTVFPLNDQSKKQIRMPAVFTAPVRPDLVRIVHTNMNKNKRQAHGVAANAGYQSSAESWGTGRAVARIPRVSGGGTHRAGQGAFGNQCRGGGMFNPLKTWRRWHRSTNKTMKRHAVASAVAASAIPPIVMARGHKVEKVAEIPLVVPASVESIKKTKQAIEILTKIGAVEDVKKSKDSKNIRAGLGKTRNRRYVLRKGPLVIYNKDEGLVRALRNLPGVETACVDRLNLLQLAPGGSLGRFCVWTEDAFAKLGDIYGTYKSASKTKSNYRLPRHMVSNPDIGRLINSEEIQSVIRPAVEGPTRAVVRKNALKNKNVMARLNPTAARKLKLARDAQTQGTAQYELVQKKKAANVAARKIHNKSANSGKKYYKSVMKAFAGEQ